MKKIFLLALIFSPLLIVAQQFEINVFQDGKRIEKNISNEIILQNKPFDLVFTFYTNTNLLVNASFEDKTYIDALNNVELSKLSGFAETGIAEGQKNKDYEVFISNSAPNAWFYEDEDYHRFNKVEIKEGKIIATRLIKQFNNIENNIVSKVEDFEGEIYFVVVFYEFDQTNFERIEYQRETLKLIVKKNYNTMKSPFLGLRTVAYFVPDLEKAKHWYSKVFETEPYFDEPYYVGFNIGGYELGLQPTNEKNANKSTGVITYWGVENINVVYENLLANGAIEVEKPKNVGGELMVASVKDPWGNIIGIIYNPEFKVE
ncbi:MAG: hypothetical protein JXL97_12510 [Bacteroidales bacterium]|nr:hypothetical protein [Bacteroidales bacterium]